MKVKFFSKLRAFMHHLRQREIPVPWKLQNPGYATDCISVVIYSWQLKLVKESQSIRTSCDDRGILFGMMVRQKLFPSESF